MKHLAFQSFYLGSLDNLLLVSQQQTTADTPRHSQIGIPMEALGLTKSHNVETIKLRHKNWFRLARIETADEQSRDATIDEPEDNLVERLLVFYLDS